MKALIGNAIAGEQIAVGSIGTDAARRFRSHTAVYDAGFIFSYHAGASAAEHPVVFLVFHHVPP
jgi:hypothetical protein